MIVYEAKIAFIYRTQAKMNAKNKLNGKFANFKNFLTSYLNFRLFCFIIAQFLPDRSLINQQYTCHLCNHLGTDCATYIQ